MFDAMSMRHIFMKITTCLALPLFYIIGEKYYRSKKNRYHYYYQ
jgi:hypothetical protein